MLRKTINGQHRYFVDTKCSTCGKKEERRRDSLKRWSGDCRSCVSKKLANRPDVKERMSVSARAQVLRQGGVPNARKFDGVNNAGSNHPKWKGGITPANVKLRNSEAYGQWRLAVYVRDEFTCVVCGQVGGKLQAHHIKSWAEHPELRFSVDNGVTVCKHCHKEVLHGGAFHKKVVAIA
jgi:HNH endonuclease